MSLRLLASSSIPQHPLTPLNRAKTVDLIARSFIAPSLVDSALHSSKRGEYKDGLARVCLACWNETGVTLAGLYGALEYELCKYAGKPSEMMRGNGFGFRLLRFYMKQNKEAAQWLQAALKQPVLDILNDQELHLDPRTAVETMVR